MTHCWYCNDELDEGEGGRITVTDMDGVHGVVIDVIWESPRRICDSTDCWVAHWRRERGAGFEKPDLSLPRSVLARVCGVRR
jgi:hypothetical protein